MKDDDTTTADDGEEIAEPEPEQQLEVRTRLQEVVERITLLGGSDEQLAWVKKEWADMQPDEQEALFRANDAVLGQQIRDGQREAAEELASQSSTPVTDAALREHAEGVKSQEDEDLELLGLRIETIMEQVGDDPEIAYRLHELEAAAHQPRKTLLAALEAIAWPNGRDVVIEGNQASTDEDAASGAS